ncbi:glycine/betaine ABC transporter substrate-binding protein [Amylibacter sp. SFDW26]|uniref:glycine betaine ABC transporter substrate-binding protein n=1 Tax=Amylibacter sp. SFDW26 TaxID=2652722 RepID=UPI001261C9C8|nr:glycine betaine ABC transporter substrate-binding protein [Amylibacter sp. SFDW26]KAB7610269.1 glycine/betaine ABC transporter substrate-binding protein [Amylibacter sp. SFDW26]
MKKNTKIAVVYATFTSATALFASQAHADCGQVSITEMGWASASIVTHVSKFIMEQGYGCEVVLVPSDTIPSIVSVSETNEPDIVTELWVANVPAYPGLVDAGKIKTVGKVLSDGGEEGWWIPDYLAEKHPELTTAKGILANPELVGSRFHNCPDGWACKISSGSMAAVLSMESKGIEVFNHGSGETLAASIAAAYEAKEPWFGYYWAPTAVLGKYPMVKVDIAPVNEEIHRCNSSAECSDNKGLSNYPTSDVITAVTTSFEDKEPKIAELMSKVSMTNAQMNGVLAWQQDNSASSEEAAVYFLSNNKETWAAWLDDDAKEKLSGFLK